MDFPDPHDPHMIWSCGFSLRCVRNWYVFVAAMVRRVHIGVLLMGRCKMAMDCGRLYALCMLVFLSEVFLFLLYCMPVFWGVFGFGKFVYEVDI